MGQVTGLPPDPAIPAHDALDLAHCSARRLAPDIRLPQVWPLLPISRRLHHLRMPLLHLVQDLHSLLGLGVLADLLVLDLAMPDLLHKAHDECVMVAGEFLGRCFGSVISGGEGL